MSGARIAPLVLFDLDGTLVDSALDLWAAMNLILQREGRAPMPLSTLRQAVSKGGRAMLAAAFPDLDAEARELRLQPFLDVYAAAVARHSLRLLARRNLRLRTEARELEAEIRRLVASTAPDLLEAFGVGPDGAATFLLTAGDNPG